MNLAEGLRVALTSLVANKMRSFLTMLGIIIGVSAVLIVVAIGEGLKADVMRQIQSLGTNLFIVIPGFGMGFGPPTRQGRLTDDDLEAIRQHLKQALAVAPEVNASTVAKYRSRNHSTRLVGTTPEWVRVRNYKLTAGRFFTESEERARAKVAVLGSAVVDELFYGRDLVGETIRVNNIPFRVVGILEEKGVGGGPGGNPDDQIVLPLNTMRSRITGGDTLGSISISAAPDAKPEVMTEEISKVLRRAHRTKPGEDDFRVMTQSQFLTMMSQTGSMMTRFLGGIALVSLLVGGVGIMNIMLVSVSERTREIGIRKAVGARRRDILAQFLIESTLLSVFGGLIGAAIGLALSGVIGGALGWKTAVPPWAVLTSLLFAAAVGVFFGLYPSRKAALLDPIECLRYE